MRLYWLNKCKNNNFRCPNCQCLMANTKGQMPKDSKNHKIQMFNGKVQCVACGNTVGYFPHKSVINGEKVRQGMTVKVLDSIEFVTAIEQDDFKE